MPPSSLLAALLVAVPLTAMAADIEIMHPWARPSLPDRPAAGYLGIHNNGPQDDRLTGARAAGAEAIALHAMREADGVVSMERLDAIDIPAGGMAHLGPGGAHLMMTGLAQPLAEGESFPVTLIFERAGEVEAMLEVTSQPMDHGSHHHGQDHGHGGHMDGHSDHGHSD